MRSPYLMAGSPESVVVRWRTDVATESVVRYGDTPESLTHTVTEAEPTTEHVVEITRLPSNATYFYSVGTSALVLAGGDAEHFFKTAPPGGSRQPIRIWVIGDSGQCAVDSTGCADAHAVKNRYLDFAGERLADVWLLLGDNAYPSGTDSQYTAGFFNVYPEIMRNTMLYPTLGNHELPASSSATQTGPYYASFTMPKNGEAGGVASGSSAYYSFDYGNVHFISIDSATQGANLEVGGPMYSWLEVDLMSNENDFTIIYWHHPPYSKGSHDSDNPNEESLFEMRERFNPLIESWGVDLQLTGHSHSYERSVLIDGHYGVSSECSAGSCFVDAGDGDPAGDGAYQKPTLGPTAHEGTVYAVVGSSSTNSGGLTQHPVMSYWLNYEGSMVIDVDGSLLDANFIDKDGNVRDHFRIEKPLPEPGAVLQLVAGAVALTLLEKRRARKSGTLLSIAREVAGCREIRSARSAASTAGRHGGSARCISVGLQHSAQPRIDPKWSRRAARSTRSRERSILSSMT